MKKVYIMVTLVLAISNVSFGQNIEPEQETALEFSRAVESRLNYKKNLSLSRLDYDLEPLDQRRFKLVFVNQPSDHVSIKIYDIIGNLILEEEKRFTIDSEIEYNLNENNGKIFVVKVESGRQNLIKRINF